MSKTMEEIKQVSLSAQEIIRIEMEERKELLKRSQTNKDGAWIRKQKPPYDLQFGLQEYWYSVINTVPAGCGPNEIGVISMLAELRRDIALLTYLAHQTEKEETAGKMLDRKANRIKLCLDIEKLLSKVSDEPYTDEKEKPKPKKKEFVPQNPIIKIETDPDQSTPRLGSETSVMDFLTPNPEIN